ncbi:methyltransferase domain-containing protein [Candidatus Woesearchaeota archaeon]|nr:methyltransferase domain-containing protein [Candidatus Woesearchaeota archaeon]
MAYIFLLSKDNLKLAKAEAETLAGKAEYSDDEIFLVKKEIDIKLLSKRLAYTKMIFQELFSCPYKDLENKMQEFEWQKVYSENFSIRKLGDTSKIKSEKSYAKFVWNKVKNPEVDLKDAKTKIILLCGKKVHVCLFLAETDKSYNKRKAHMRPSLHPTSLNPKLAKAMVNLTGAVKGNVICDPFCGSGGILIEAGLMQMKTIGIDISRMMLKRAEKNLEHYKVKNFKLLEGDATKMRVKADFVVADLPYGKSSKITEKHEKLYLNFLRNIKNWAVKKSVIGFPDFVDYKKIIKQAGFTIENEFEQYIHKSLVKKIVVIK